MVTNLIRWLLQNREVYTNEPPRKLRFQIPCKRLWQPPVSQDFWVLPLPRQGASSKGKTEREKRKKGEEILLKYKQNLLLRRN